MNFITMDFPGSRRVNISQHVCQDSKNKYYQICISFWNYTVICVNMNCGIYIYVNKIAYILIYLTNSIKIYMYFICIWHKYFLISWVALLQPIVLNMINIDTLIIRHSSYVTLTCDVIAVIIMSYCLQARQVQFYKTPIRQDTRV